MVGGFEPGWRHSSLGGRLVGAVAVLALLSLAPAPTTAMHESDAVADEDLAPFEVIHHTGGLVEAFCTDGDQLYLGIGSRLVVLNGDTKGGVPEGGTQYVALPYPIQDAAVVASRLVAVLAGDVVFYIDTSDPDSMTIVGTYDHGEELGGIESWGGSIFLLGDDDLFVVDSSDPASANHVGTLPLPNALGSRSTFQAGDGVVFLGHGGAGVIVVDVSDPTEPRLIGTVGEEISVYGMATAGRRLYIHDGSDRFDGSGKRVVGVFVHVVDVGVDGALTHHGPLELLEATPLPQVFNVVELVAGGDFLHITGSETGSEAHLWERQVRTWDMSDLSDPVALPLVAYPKLGSAVATAVANERVYIVSNDAALVPDYQYQSPGVGVVDVAMPDAPEWKGFWQLDDLGRVSFLDANASGVAIKEGNSPVIHLYQGKYEGGWSRSGYIDTGPRAATLRMTDDHVYTLGRGNLAVYDIRDMMDTSLIATAPMVPGRTSLAVDEPYVYAHVGCVGTSRPGGDPYCALVSLELVGGVGSARLEELTQVPVGREMRDIAVGGGYAYLVTRQERDYQEHLALYDVRDPANPRFVENIAMGDTVWPKRTVLHDGLAYVAMRRLTRDSEPRTTGLAILDVADAPVVSVLGSVDAATGVDQSRESEEHNGHLALSGDYALFSCDESTVHVIDVSDPTRPHEVQRFELPDIVADIAAGSGQVYVVSKDGGMIVLRATGAERPPEPEPEPAVYLPLIQSR